MSRTLPPPFSRCFQRMLRPDDGWNMSTAQYFPLVDGARYEYMFVSGPRTTATAVDAWRPVVGRRDESHHVHMTFACKPAIPCADDATDSTGWTRRHALLRRRRQHFLPTDHVHDDYYGPEWMLKNPRDSRNDDGAGQLPGFRDVADAGSRHEPA